VGIHLGVWGRLLMTYRGPFRWAFTLDFKLDLSQPIDDRFTGYFALILGTGMRKPIDSYFDGYFAMGFGSAWSRLVLISICVGF